MKQTEDDLSWFQDLLIEWLSSLFWIRITQTHQQITENHSTTQKPRYDAKSFPRLLHRQNPSPPLVSAHLAQRGAVGEGLQVRQGAAAEDQTLPGCGRPRVLEKAAEAKKDPLKIVENPSKAFK